MTSYRYSDCCNRQTAILELSTETQYTRIPLGLVVMIIVVVCLDLEVLLIAVFRSIDLTIGHVLHRR